MCQDKSYLIIRNIENKNIRMIREALITRIKKKKVVVAFIDDTDIINNKEIA